MKKILVLFGGNSFEHAISCKSAKTILENIDRKKFETTAVGIDKSNNWYIFDDNLELLTNNKWLEGNKFDFYETFGMTKYDATDSIKVVLNYYGELVTIALEKVK